MPGQADFLPDAERYVRGTRALHDALRVDAARISALHPLGAGEHNLNYWFADDAGGRKFVLRVNVASQVFHADQVSYEFAALQALEPSGCTPLPLFLDNSPQAPGKGVLVESFCEGGELDFDNLRPGDLRCAAQLMANVHAVPVSSACPLHRPADPLRELYAECVQRFELYRTSAFEDARISRRVEALMRKTEPTLSTPCAPGDCTHIVNSETLPSHFLIPQEAAAAAARAAGSTGALGFTPGAFIDWERPIIGEVAQDIAYFVAPTTTFWDSEYLFPTRNVRAFVDAYWRAVDGRFGQGNFEQRFEAYRRVTVLRGVTWCCKALVTFGADPNAYRTPKAERKLPVYLSDDFFDLLEQDCF